MRARRGMAAWTTYELPGGWNEVTLDQLLVLLASNVLVADRSVRRMSAFRVLTGMDERTWLKLLHSEVVVQDLVQAVEREDENGARATVAELLPQLAWMEEPPCYSRSLLPVLEHGGARWIGPGREDLPLHNFSVQRWGIANDLQKRYQASRSDEHLNELLGALYHRHDTAWTMADCDARGARLADLPDRLRVAAVVNYAALNAMLARIYPRSFAGGAADPYGSHGMLVGLAETTAFAGMDDHGRLKVERANLHDVLVHTEKALMRQEERERERKTNTTPA